MSFASYQTGTPDGQPANTSNLLEEGSRPLHVRSDSGVAVYDGNVETKSPYQGLNTASLPNGETGILATARTPWGTPRNSTELTADDLVTIQGQQMRLEIAQRLGFVERGPNGRWIEVPQNTAQEPSKGTEETPQGELGDALPDTAAESDLASLCAGVTPSTQIAVLNQIVEAGDIHQNTINRAASEAGLNPELVGEQLVRVMAGFEAQAEATVQALGSDDPEEFWTFCREERPREFKDAMRKHGTERSVDGYRTLYREFVETYADRNPQAVLEAEFGSGITARVDGKNVVLSIPGHGQMSYRAAIKAGLISVRGA